MKKTLFLIYTILTALSISFSSCKLSVEDEALFDKPGVIPTNNQITIIIPKTSNDTKYINVYRRDKKNDKIVNIGLIFHPQALEDDPKNYSYIDTLVKKKHSYDYRVRYYTDGKYYLSQWSKTIYIDTDYNAYPEEQNLSYQATNASLIYERTDYSISFSGTITPPDFPEFASEGYIPMIVISSDKATQAFEIPLTSIENSSNRTPIALRSMLPSDFLDTAITVQGIIGQKTLYTADASKREIKEIIWTELEPVKLTAFGSSNSIKIPAQAGSSGLDYSRKAE